MVFILVYLALTAGLALFLLRERGGPQEPGAHSREAPDVA